MKPAFRSKNVLKSAAQDSFMQAIDPSMSSWFPCKFLCESSLEYISKTMGLTLPTKHGVYCQTSDGNGTCAWKPIGEDAMTDTAFDSDMTAKFNNQSGEQDQ